MQKITLSLITLLTWANLAWAQNYDFTVQDANDNTIYMKIIPDTLPLMAEVTWGGEESYSDDVKYAGDIIIPASADFDGNTYVVTRIGANAFFGCENLISIVVPNTVTIINENAFQNCFAATSINIPNGVTEIGTRAFAGCNSLESIEIPNTVTVINDGAFSYCIAITSINIPNSVTKIGSSAFIRCRSLKSIVLPSSIEHIESLAFDFCEAIEEIICHAVEPPTVGRFGPVIDEKVQKKIQLYVPEESIDNYKNAAFWEDFRKPMIISED